MKILATILGLCMAISIVYSDEGAWWGYIYDNDGDPAQYSFKDLYIYHVPTGGTGFSYNYCPLQSKYCTQTFANGQEYGIYAHIKISGVNYYSNCYYATFWGYGIHQDLSCTRTSPPPLKEGEPGCFDINHVLTNHSLWYDCIQRVYNHTAK